MIDAERVGVGFAIALLALAIAHAQPASACRFGPPTELEIGDTASSPELPSAPAVRSVEVRRAESTGGCGGSSCDDIGSVTIALAATDDTEPVGFSFQVIEGELPPHLVLRPSVVRPPVGEDRITFHFSDPDPAPFYARIAVTTVDIAGNESAEVTEIEVADGQFEGCTATSRAATGTILPVLLALGLLRTTRRR